MTHIAGLSLGTIKEVRAMMPTWLACMAALGIAGGLGDSTRYRFGLLAYVLGAVMLGAQSMGHEYTHRTLSLLLSQPIDRRRLFLIKHGVLASMLLALGAFAWSLLFNNAAFLPPSLGYAPPHLLLVALGSLCVAPYLTMWCRSPLAGVVFTIPLPGWLWILGEGVGIAWYGRQQAIEIDRLRLLIFWNGMLVVCALAVVAGWRLFMRLEAIEGRDPDLRLPSWLSRGTTTVAPAGVTAARHRHPMWLLAKKELRLQQMAFVVAGLYHLLWVMAATFRHSVPAVPDTIAAAGILSGGLIALLIGSVASAEERQLGTIEWQALLPIAMWKQWAIKTGMALGLAVVLAFGLSTWLADVAINGGYASVIIILTTGSLYISSLCNSGLKALVLSGAAIIICAVFAQSAIALLHVWLFTNPPGASWVPAVLLAGFVAHLVWFAFQNHRSADRGTWRVVRQIAWMAGFLTMGIALWAAVTVVI